MGSVKGFAAACYTNLRVCFVCVQQLSGSLVTPFDCIFFPSFLPRLYSSLPKSRQRVITRFCPTSPTVEATQRFRPAPFTTLTDKNFCRGFPQQTSFNKSKSSDPARKNSQHNSRFVLSTHSSQKPQKFQQLTVRSAWFEAAAHSKQLPTSRKLAPNNTFSSHGITNVDEPAHETTRKSFPDHLDKCKKLLETQCATKNYMGRAFPTCAQQGISTIKQEDRHEHEGKGQRHRIGIHWQLLFRSGGPPLRDDDCSHQDANDRATIRFVSDTIVNRPWQGRQLFQAASQGHVRRLNP